MTYSEREKSDKALAINPSMFLSIVSTNNNCSLSKLKIFDGNTEGNRRDLTNTPGSIFQGPAAAARGWRAFMGFIITPSINPYSLASFAPMKKSRSVS